MPIRTKQSKIEYITELSQSTAHELSRNAEHWRDFLITAAALYKYEFPDQLLIHAQRPDATACAELDIWNRRMNRYVNRGAKGIALIDDRGNAPRLRYVFDISDTRPSRYGTSRTPYRWEVTEENTEHILSMLHNRYGVNNKYFTDAVKRSAERLVNDNLDEYVHEIMQSKADSFMEEMDRVNIRKNFRDLAVNSVEYCILTRFGYKADDFIPLDDFSAVCDFNTIDTMAVLGTAVSSLSEEILRDTERSIREFELQKRKERTYQNGLQGTERILASSSRNRAGRTGDTGQIRSASEGVSEEPQENTVQSAPAVGTAAPASHRDRADSGEAKGRDNEPSDGAAATAAENETDGVGTPHEQSGADSGRNDYVRADLLQLDYHDRSTERNDIPSFSRNEDIYELLRSTPYLSASKEDIIGFFEAHDDESERTEYIKGIFNNDYTELLLGDNKDHRVGYKTYSNVLHIWEGGYTDRTAETYFNWSVIAGYFSAMILLDAFLDKQPQRGQLSLFDEPTEERSSVFYFNQKIIDAVLCTGSGFENGKLRIYKQFSENTDISENIRFLRNDYGTGGKYPAIPCTNINEEHDSKGIELRRGDTKLMLSWNKAAQRIAELVSEGRYLTSSELARYEREYGEHSDEPEITADGSREYSPIYANYLRLKAEHEDELLLFRLGDFYELFNDDALHAAEVLELVLTSRDNGVERVPMCGFPQHSLGIYIERLVQHGFDVAVAEVGEAGQRQVTHVYSETFEITKDMYQTDTADIFVVPDNNGVLAKIDLTPSEELFARLEEHGVTRTEDSQNRILLDTDGRQWNKLVIPDKWGNLTNSIDASEFLTQAEYAVMLEVAHEVTGSAYTEHTTEIEETADNISGAVEEALSVPMPENFHITDDHLGAGGLKTKFRNNIEAIKTLQLIEQENRYATPEEQEVLSRYIGWGGMPQAFDSENSDWSKEYAELKGLLSVREYSAAQSSTLSSFYTSPTVIKGIYNALSNMGFTTGNILEPSCGVGNFFGLLPEEMSDSKLYGVELDSISGRIAKQLYPHADIQNVGYENSELPDNFFDVVIGNIPFGSYKVSDKRYNNLNYNIHDYFIAKSLDKVRAGGVIAVVTSSGTMDKQNPSVRRYIAQRAELLGAIRLPNNAFKENANTEVTADILFFQKRDRMIEIEPKWIFTGMDENGFMLNQYFIDNPNMVLGTITEGNKLYGRVITCVPIERADLSEQLAEAVKNIDGSIPEITLDDISDGTSEQTTIPADPTVKNYSYTVVDDDIYYRVNSIMEKMELPKATSERIKGMIEIRECVRTLMDLQLDENTDEEIQHQQSELNKLYDSFTEKYGLISSSGNKRAFRRDSSYYLLSSLEVLDENGELERKADMFTKRTIKQHKQITSVNSSIEALAVSIGEQACVDIPFIEQLTGFTEEKIISDLRGLIFQNPMRIDDNGNYVWETADEYLSGNVREKLRFAEARAEKEPEFAVNVDALSKVIPKDLEAGEIDVRLGVTWIDLEYLNQFMHELFETAWYKRNSIEIMYSTYTTEWRISNKRSDFDNVKATVTYGTKRINGYEILEAALNMRDVKIYDTKQDADGRDIRVLNTTETTLARQKQDLIKQEFKDWIFKDMDRRTALVRKYNDKFNSIRPREYDGSHLVFDGMNPEITLRPHQLNAIAHAIYGYNTLFAHEVGAGKSFEMIASAMESKRLGLCSKSLFVVPNHLTEQMGADILRLYPSANILVTTQDDFTKDNRRKLCAKIATGDFDIVVIGHSQLIKIPISNERQEKYIRDQLDDVENGIRDLKTTKGERFQIKQLERTKRNLEARLKKLAESTVRDDVVTFEELGIDRLFIDEADMFKNAYFFTKMSNVAGVAQTEAQKSSDLMMKCRYMDELTDGRGTIFATGTPVSNSMTEVYTMMNYLQHDTLVKMGWQHFDAWAAHFGETITAMEIAPEGKGYRAKTRFAKFFNLPELMSVFKECADIKTADVLNLPTPEAHYETVVAEPTEIQKNMVDALAERAKKIHNKEIRPEEDNMLCVTNDGRKIGLDQRLINPLLPDEEGTKVNLCVDNVFKIWKDTADNRSTQLIFCDYSTPKGDGSFNVYDDIREKLVKRGVPKEEIAFIHEANTDAQKKELFAKMRKGITRVLIGSTAKCGAGTNIQDKLIAMHDLDAPWRPRDLIQRSGRIVRQGNENKEVTIFRYVTNATFDSYLWQTLENKQRFISQIMTSKSPVRSCEDADETTLSYAEVKALCAGDERIKEKMNLDVEVTKLKLMKANHNNQQYALEDSVHKHFPEMIAKTKERIAGYEQDLAYIRSQTVPANGFAPMTIQGKEYIEKADAGKALLDVCSTVKGLAETDIGKYMGFDMSVKLGTYFTDYTLTLKHIMSYEVSLGSDVYGNITRINNVLGSIEVSLNDSKARLENLEIQLENAKSELGKPFPHEAELKSKSERLSYLNSQLDLDENANEEQAAELPKEPVKPVFNINRSSAPPMPLPVQQPYQAAVSMDKPKAKQSVRERLKAYKAMADKHNSSKSADIQKEL